MRNNLEIMANILSLAKMGANKTRLVYGANLNFNIIKGYIQSVIAYQLLTKNGKLYCTTEKGKTFLVRYQNLKRMIS